MLGEKSATVILLEEQFQKENIFMQAKTLWKAINISVQSNYELFYSWDVKSPEINFFNLLLQRSTRLRSEFTKILR